MWFKASFGCTGFDPTTFRTWARVCSSTYTTAFANDIVVVIAALSLKIMWQSHHVDIFANQHRQFSDLWKKLWRKMTDRWKNCLNFTLKRMIERKLSYNCKYWKTNSNSDSNSKNNKHNSLENSENGIILRPHILSCSRSVTTDWSGRPRGRRVRSLVAGSERGRCSDNLGLESFNFLFEASTLRTYLFKARSHYSVSKCAE